MTRAQMEKRQNIQGKDIQPVEPHEDQERGATGGEPRPGEEETKSAGSMDLAALYKFLEKESFKQEQRWRSVQVQMNQLWDELEVERSSRGGRSSLNTELPRGEPSAPPRAPTPEPSAPTPLTAWSRIAVPRLEEGDDVEQFLTTFERLATAYRWPQTDWAVILVPYLTGKARAAYVAMDSDDSLDYELVKEAILAKYEINMEVYRQRFRDPTIKPGETPKEL